MIRPITGRIAMPRAVAAAVIIFACAGCGDDAPPKPAPPDFDALVGERSGLAGGDRIVFFGDSITWEGAKPDGYVWLIERAIEESRAGGAIEVIAAGVPGNHVSDLLARLDADVLARRPTLVFVFIGINDVWWLSRGRGTPKAAFESQLRDLVRRINEVGATVVLATPTVIGERKAGANALDALLDDYAAIIRRIAAEVGATVCDLRAAFIEHLGAHNHADADKGLLTRDGVHLTAPGNRLVAAHAAAAIARALRQGD